MTIHTYTVTVDAASSEKAEVVMNERIMCDEDYGFDYTIDYRDSHEHDLLIAVTEAIEYIEAVCENLGDDPESIPQYRTLTNAHEALTGAAT